MFLTDRFAKSCVSNRLTGYPHAWLGPRRIRCDEIGPRRSVSRRFCCGEERRRRLEVGVKLEDGELVVARKLCKNRRWHNSQSCCHQAKLYIFGSHIVFFTETKLWIRWTVQKCLIEIEFGGFFSRIDGYKKTKREIVHQMQILPFFWIF